MGAYALVQVRFLSLMPCIFHFFRFLTAGFHSLRIVHYCVLFGMLTPSTIRLDCLPLPPRFIGFIIIGAARKFGQHR
jgi:hypothetical protein